MCTSCLTLVFTLVLLASTVLILTALATPGWQKLEVQMKNSSAKGSSQVTKTISVGLFVRECLFDAHHCFLNVWNDLDHHQQVTTLLLLCALVFCCLAAVWSCAICCVCCGKSCLLMPLPVFCSIAFAFTLAAILTFTLETKNISTIIDDELKVIRNLEDLKRTFGFSIYLAILGAAGLVVSVIVSSAMMCTARVFPV